MLLPLTGAVEASLFTGEYWGDVTFVNFSKVQSYLNEDNGQN